MPNATATLGWTVANWGDAPATYTLASDCTASTDLHIVHTNGPSVPIWPETCTTTAAVETCWPTPTDSDLASAATNRYSGAYWSGVNCPSGWSSIGEAAHPTNGPVTSSGVFTIQARLDGDDDDYDWDDIDFDRDDDNDDDDFIVFGFQDALGALLEFGETAIACCPRSMSVGRNGLCYTTLPSHTVTTACVPRYSPFVPNLVSTTYVLDGTTHTGRIFVPATDNDPLLPTSTSTTTFRSQQTNDLVAASLITPIYVVHRDGDEPGPSQTGGANESDNGSGSGNTNPEETNGAATLHGGPGMAHWGQIKVMGGVLGASVLAGMFFVLPW
ncbi:hypothetical protein ASPCAL12754 [Aspergillus calidoustus]|uniref:Uncharacterized protein n=1 Tax=Aspergillus calidoustus TaxID=454130 RepID=A0A0U4ZJ90_ASPCI|nr:hypothetical protein ASPCAL12754 [Aspergillus calidoustus]